MQRVNLLDDCHIVMQNNQQPIPLKTAVNYTICDSLLDVLIQFRQQIGNINSELGIDEAVEDFTHRINLMLEQYERFLDEKPLERSEKQRLQDIVHTKGEHDIGVFEATQRFNALLAVGEFDVLAKEKFDLSYLGLTKQGLYNVSCYLVVEIIGDDRAFLLPIENYSERITEDFLKYVFSKVQPNNLLEKVLFSSIAEKNSDDLE